MEGKRVLKRDSKKCRDNKKTCNYYSIIQGGNFLCRSKIMGCNLNENVDDLLTLKTKNVQNSVLTSWGSRHRL